MKKIILLSLIFFAAVMVKAQSCTPDNSITTPGLYPAYLDTGSVGAAYSHTIQVKAIKDTTVIFNNVPITATVDSIIVIDIQGLPGDFSYECNNARCKFTNQNVGCISLTGNPTAAEKGEHALDIYVTAYARYNTFKLPVNDTISDFVLVIEDSATASIKHISELEVSIRPNPVTGNFMDVQCAQVIKNIKMYDEWGRVVTDLSNINQKQKSIDCTDLIKGIYYLELQTEQGVLTKKILK